MPKQLAHRSGWATLTPVPFLCHTDVIAVWALDGTFAFLVLPEDSIATNREMQTGRPGHRLSAAGKIKGC